MRNIDKLIIHCSATRECDDSVNTSVIDRWHKARGWKGCGYHFIVLIDGTIETGRMIDEVGAHVKGMNKSSIGICYIGGLKQDAKTPKDTRTPKQKESLLLLIKTLKKIYPEATLHGHNEFSNKACPSFDVQSQYKDI
jgi:N-acetylmuramoyl-L-alanine amidase|eukprot:COSAG01_NODE_1329_length_10704_cov_34.202074_8_plen_138_part_00